MTKLLLCGACFAALATAPAAAQTFNGPYVGANIGYAWGKSDVDNTLSGNWITVEPLALQTFVIDATSPTLKPNGITGGVQAGYNASVGGGIVLGVEGEFNLLDAEDSEGGNFVFSPSLNYDVDNSVDAKWMAALKLKAGVEFGNTMAYVDGGVAWVKADYDAAILSNGGYAKAGGTSKTTNGYIIGAGIEHKINPSFSVRLHYSYTDQGDVDFDTVFLPGSTFPGYFESYEQDLKIQSLRFGANFHF
jgi:outer membrane immunogenic protein